MQYIKEFNKPKKKILKKEPTITKDSVVVDSYLGEYVEIGEHNNIQESKIDSYSYTGEYCQIIYAHIKKFANIASYVRINPGQHPMHRASLHHMLYRREMFGFGQDDSDFFNSRREKNVYIGNDTWIGHNVTIMGGVYVGDGAVIGSGAIVTKDIPAYAIAVGNPAKVIKFRFDYEVINELQKIAWWDWDHETIKKRINDFNSIEIFLKKYGH